jgi:hypothetical protein
MHDNSERITLFDIILTVRYFNSYISVPAREELLTSTAIVTAGRPRTLRRPADGNGIIVAAVQKPPEVVRSKPSFSHILLDDQMGLSCY